MFTDSNITYLSTQCLKRYINICLEDSVFPIMVSSQADFGSICAHCAKSVRLGRILVQYVSLDFFADHVFKGLLLDI